MHNILVTYATLSGTTVEVAKEIAQAISKTGAKVEVRPMAEVKTLKGYTGVVAGAPMIAGWHHSALTFVGRNKESWKTLPLAAFITAMSLTRTLTSSVEGVPLCIDDGLPMPARDALHLSLRERYARVENYVRPILRAARPGKPTSIAVLGGRLEYGRLPWWAVLFAMLVIQAPAGDKNNWPFIRQWAAGIPETFERAATRSEGEDATDGCL